MKQPPHTTQPSGGSLPGGPEKIILAGGGTGGHIFPAIAIANALRRQRPDCEILFVGAKGKMEMEKVPQAGYPIRGIDIAGFNRSSLIKNLGLPYKLVKSYFQVRAIFADFMPDAVIGVGGYSSFPVLRYAQSKGIPSFIHESNSFAGKSNQLLANKATRIFVAAPGMEKFFPAGKITLTGNPVRAAIVQSQWSQAQGLESFGLKPGLTTVLVTGGSLGARGINEAIEARIAELGPAGVQLIWQTGKPFASRAAAATKDQPHIWTGDFISAMEKAYAAADLVVSRAGAMAIAELCVAAKPAILVPFPYAAEDHQTANAQVLVDRQAGIMIADAAAREQLVPAILALAANPGQRQTLKENISKLAIKDADRQIAAAVLASIHIA